MAPGDRGAPHWLRHPTRTNYDVPPDQWALSCAQLFHFLDTCRHQPEWGRIIAEQGYVSAYSVNQDFVIPWTRGTGAGVALNMNAENPLAAELMISHAWKEDILEFQEALQTFVQRSSLSLRTPVWFCLLALYQAGEWDYQKAGPQIEEQLQRDPFGCIIRRVTQHHGVLVVHTTQAEVYERLWCVYEMAEAVRMKSPTHAAFSDEYVKANTISVLDVVRVHTKQAKCTSDGDRLMIRKKVKKVGGFKQLDARIFRFRLQALVELFALKQTTMDANKFEQEIEAAENELKRMLKAINRRKLSLACIAVVITALFLGITSWGALLLLSDESGLEVTFLFSVRSSSNDGYDTGNGATVGLDPNVTSMTTTPPPEEPPLVVSDEDNASPFRVAAEVVCIVASLFTLTLCMACCLRRAFCRDSLFESDESAISDLQQRLQFARRRHNQDTQRLGGDTAHDT